MGDEAAGVLVVAKATHNQKDLFFLVQSELVDIYKMTLSYLCDEVHDVHIIKFLDRRAWRRRDVRAQYRQGRAERQGVEAAHAQEDYMYELQ